MNVACTRRHQTKSLPLLPQNKPRRTLLDIPYLCQIEMGIGGYADQTGQHRINSGTSSQRRLSPGRGRQSSGGIRGADLGFWGAIGHRMGSQWAGIGGLLAFAGSSQHGRTQAPAYLIWAYRIPGDYGFTPSSPKPGKSMPPRGYLARWPCPQGGRFQSGDAPKRAVSSDPMPHWGTWEHRFGQGFRRPASKHGWRAREHTAEVG